MIRGREAAKDAATGLTAGSLAGGAVAEATVGLEQAAAAAGSALDSAIGLLPWNLAPGGVADLVGQGTSAAVAARLGDILVAATAAPAPGGWLM